MSGESDEGRGFTIIDRRHGRESGEPVNEGRREEPPRPRPEPAHPSPGGRPGGAGGPPPGAAGGLPEMDFSTFLISLSTSALYQMGLIAEREGAEPPEPNLPMARQTIDILELLQHKTLGNLDADEEHLLESLLYELRLRFVEAQGRK